MLPATRKTPGERKDKLSTLSSLKTETYVLALPQKVVIEEVSI
jgi:hypothetical protein